MRSLSTFDYFYRKTGAVFIVYGVYVKEIISNGAITTYGTNDMVLDVWGTVDN